MTRLDAPIYLCHIWTKMAREKKMTGRRLFEDDFLMTENVFELTPMNQPGGTHVF